MKQIYLVKLAVAAILLSGCHYLYPSETGIPERHRELARQLYHVTLKVEGELTYGDGFKDASTIIPYLQKNHPQSYAQFKDETLRFRIDRGHVIGLVCDKDEGYAIAEDSPCTVDADVTYPDTKKPCAFTIKNLEKCVGNR